MKKPLASAVLLTAVLFALAASPASAEDLDLRILEARDTFREFTMIPEDSIPRDFIAKARGILIFPNMLKGGFLYAAKFGLGVVIIREDDSEEWSPPAFIRMSGGSFGLQLGADWTDLILVAKSEVAVRAFLQNRFSLGGSLAAVAGPWGRHTELDIDWQLRGAMFSYARSKGLFAAVATDGSVISFDDDANTRYYGKRATGQEIVFEGAGSMTAAGRELIEEIESYGYNREPRPSKKQGNRRYEYEEDDEYADENDGESYSDQDYEGNPFEDDQNRSGKRAKRSYEYRSNPRYYEN